MALKRRFKYLQSALTAAQKLEITSAMLYDIAQYNVHAAVKLRLEHLRQTGGVAEEAAQLWFDWWHVAIDSYPDMKQLKTLVQYKAAASTELARVSYGNAPLIVKTIVR